MTPSIRQNSRLAPLLIGLLIFLQLIQPYRGWMILLFGLGGAWIFSYLWIRSLSQNLRLRREMRFGWAQVGDQLEERFTIENTGWAPAVWVVNIWGHLRLRLWLLTNPPHLKQLDSKKTPKN